MRPKIKQAFESWFSRTTRGPDRWMEPWEVRKWELDMEAAFRAGFQAGREYENHAAWLRQNP